MTTKLPQEQIDYRVCLLAIEDIGRAMVSLSMFLAQGVREDNAGLRGGIAVGLERAAAHIRGQRFGDVEVTGANNVVISTTLISTSEPDPEPPIDVAALVDAAMGHTLPKPPED